MAPLLTPRQQALKARAAQLLITPSALEELSLEDAAKIVEYMTPCEVEAGTVVMREGDTDAGGHMLLVVEGDLSVEKSGPQPDDDKLVVRVMGAGSLIGELSLLDGAPRSASCVATSDMVLALLSRERFLQLLQDEPRVGARLLLGISKRLADHLRETTRKLELFAKMNKVLSEELTTLSLGRADWNQWGRGSEADNVSEAEPGKGS